MFRTLSGALGLLAGGLLACESTADSVTGTGGESSSGVGGDPSNCSTTQAPSGPWTIYLAFDGVTLESVADGEDDATIPASSLVPGTTVVPPFREGDPGRQEVIDTLLTDLNVVFSPFAVTITTVRPDGDHMMVVFSGEDAGALIGLVRLDCGAVVRNDVAIMFDGVADPDRGRYAMANETVFAFTRSIGLAKSNGPGHPCSCDPSGTCSNDELCQLTSDAIVTFSECPGAGETQDEITAFANTFGCD